MCSDCASDSPPQDIETLCARLASAESTLLRVQDTARSAICHGDELDAILSIDNLVTFWRENK